MALTLEGTRYQRPGALSARLAEKLLREACLADACLSGYYHHTAALGVLSPCVEQAAQLGIASHKRHVTALWRRRWRGWGRLRGGDRRGHSGFVAVASSQLRQWRQLFRAQRLIEVGRGFERRDTQFFVQHLDAAAILLQRSRPLASPGVDSHQQAMCRFV